MIESNKLPLISNGGYHYQMVNLSDGNKTVKILSNYTNPKGMG